MTETENKPDIIDETPDNWEDPEIEIDAKEKKYCCDAEKRRRLEQMREERELERELREFYDD